MEECLIFLLGAGGPFGVLVEEWLFFPVDDFLRQSESIYLF